MPTSFPAIEPSSRRFKTAEFATTSQTSQSGVTTRRLWADRPSNATLDLQFKNISDTNTSAILSAYNAAKGPVDELSLPVVLFNGADSTLKTYLNTTATGADLIWSFAEDSPPVVESVAPNRSTVTVKLVAELRMS